jgi:LCP family protein required for cell wall assembly
MTFTSRRLSEGKTERSAEIGAAVIAAAPLVIKTSRGLLGWYRKRKARLAEEQRERKRWRLLRKLGIGAGIVLVGVAVIGGTVKALVAAHILTPRSILAVAGSDLPTDANGFTNFLLLGVGDKDHDGVDLTDSMMIASIDPKTRSVVLLSLPRDLYIQDSRVMGSGRINGLFKSYKWSLVHDGMNQEEASIKALRELADELGRRLDLTIHHAMMVDFTGFVDAVDALGGVDVDVPKDLVDTQYPGPNYSYETFQIAAGPQHLDGETALKYARSRHSTSDFDRSARQQQIIHALGEAAKAQGIAGSPGKLSAFLKIFSEHVHTTMSFRELLGTAKLGEKIDRQNIISMHLSDGSNAPGGFLYAPPRAAFGGAAILLPYALPPDPTGSWHQIRTFAFLLLRNRAIYLSHPQIYLLNAGAPNGLAKTLGLELARYGLEPTEILNASDDRKSPLRNLSGSFIAVRGAETGTGVFLSGLLKLPLQPLPPEFDPERAGPVTIVLGKNFQYRSIQSLVGLAADARGDTVPMPAEPSSDASASLSSSGTSASAQAASASSAPPDTHAIDSWIGTDASSSVTP